ncbi:hypothetical protein OIE13_22325 [Streptosporangium sp. NBC_01810]|uniref:hypothetical protein n=1 Tax=Streptosporangium sp. NBC_01810 TaxID=2975951 RepID=UPI002DDAB8CE|nr:hypothetical protein [Streptosporangium sp. NBC_01810]WSA23680.1 hypothetical protein OIE13_22325 [Streptosporangium sp. NBC_01810]
MADAELDFSELLKLPHEIEDSAQRTAEKAYPVAKKFAEKLQRDWRRNARVTALPHGPHYPRAITAEQKYALDGPDWEVGPESAMPQGGMGRGFEYGSVNQPPHLDGARATTGIEAQFAAAAKKIADGFLS